MQLLKQVYQGKKVFLTGHTGFKGAWLLKILNLLGAEVKGYALPPENEFDLFNLIEGAQMCQSVISDIRDKERLRSEIKAFQPDFIFHLAAQPLVRLSYQKAVETFEINAIGTANLLESIKALDNPCSVVLITTDKVYHNNEWLYPYRETDRLGGYDPYSASKACAELIIDSYRNSFFNPDNYNTHKKAIAVARAGNVIGGGDWAKDRLIPDIARALGKKEKIVLRNPAAIRPWQHVLEPLVGYLVLGTSLSTDHRDFSQAYNFGPNADDVLSVEQMVQLAIQSWGGGSYEKFEQAGQLHEAQILKLDISKAIAELQWRPKMNVAQAIQNTIEWYKMYFNNKGQIQAFTEKQILDFIS